MMMDYVWLIPVFPFLGFIINGLVGKNLPKNVVGTLGSLMVGLSFLLTVAIFLEFLKLPVDARHVEKVVYTWMTAGSFKVHAAFLIDPLSLIMLLVVSGVSTLIHIYSIGYMHDDPGFYRFFTYLNLFVAMMLILVSANAHNCSVGADIAIQVVVDRQRAESGFGVQHVEAESKLVAGGDILSQLLP